MKSPAGLSSEVISWINEALTLLAEVDLLYEVDTVDGELKKKKHEHLFRLGFFGVNGSIFFSSKWLIDFADVFKTK